MKKLFLFLSIILTNDLVFSAQQATPTLDAQSNKQMSPKAQDLRNNFSSVIDTRDYYTGILEQYLCWVPKAAENQDELSASALTSASTVYTPKIQYDKQGDKEQQIKQRRIKRTYVMRMEQIIKQIIQLGSYQYQHYQKLNASVKTLHETLEEFRSNKQKKPATAEIQFNQKNLAELLKHNSIQYIMLTGSKIETLILYIKELTKKTFELRSNLDNIKKALYKGTTQDQENDDQQQNNQDHQNYNDIPKKIKELKNQIINLQQQLQDQQQQFNEKQEKDQNLQDKIQQHIGNLQQQQQTAQQDQLQQLQNNQQQQEEQSQKTQEQTTQNIENQQPELQKLIQQIDQDQKTEMEELRNSQQTQQTQLNTQIQEQLQKIQAETHTNNAISLIFELYEFKIQTLQDQLKEKNTELNKSLSEKWAWIKAAKTVQLMLEQKQQ